MILTFSNGPGGAQMIAIDGGKPLHQQHGCETMFNSAELCGGALSISDKLIDGWAKPCTWSGYFYGSIEGYGQVVSGALVGPVCEAIGFSLNYKKWCWSAANNFHKCTPDQAREVMNMNGQRKADYKKINEYLAGLYPVEVVQKAIESKPKAIKKKVAEIAF